VQQNWKNIGWGTIIFLAALTRLGHVLNTDFEQILLQRDAVGAKAGEVLDTFVYFRGIQGGDWGFTAAVGLVKGLVGATLVFAANRAAKTLGEGGLF